MHLREVSLRNWRSYRNAIFRFPRPVGKKRVVLVGAMNGHGKTSLLSALYLGLFGREAMSFLEGVRLGGTNDERIKSYRQLMQRILHRPALDTEDPLASVTLVFEGDEDETVVVTRTWHYTRGGVPRDLDTADGEEVRIEEGGRAKRPASWQDANNKLADLLFPAHVVPCFFFDGEQAQERVEASGGAALSQAINALYGTGLVTELEESLRNYASTQRAALKRDQGDVGEDDLDQKRLQRDQIESELAKIAKELSKAKHDLSAAEASRQEKIVELTNLTGDAAVDFKLLSDRKVDLETEMNDLRSKLCDSLALLALPMAVQKVGPAAVRQLEAESIRDRWLLLRDETVAKVEHIADRALPPPGDHAIEPPLDEGQHAALSKRLHAALESLWSPPPEGCADAYKYLFLGASDRVSTRQRLMALRSVTVADVGAIASQWQASRAKLLEVQRKWDGVRDLVPRVENLKQRITELNSKISDLQMNKSRLETLERGRQNELNNLRGAIGQMESLQRKLGPVEQKLDLADRVREVIRDTRDRLVPICKSSLEESCTQHFQAMITSEYRRYRIEFDDDLQPRLVGAKPEPIYITTLSGAQKRAFGLAFTLAVAEVSDQEAPIVIDTPVGNMDSEYRTRILTYLAQSARGQLIFLSHNEEIYGEYVRALEPYLAETFLIQFEPAGDGAGVSTVEQGRYFSRRGK